MISQNMNKSVKRGKKNKLDKAFATQLQFTNFRYDDISPLFGEGKLGLLHPKMRVKALLLGLLLLLCCRTSS